MITYILSLIFYTLFHLAGSLCGWEEHIVTARRAQCTLPTLMAVELYTDDDSPDRLKVRHEALLVFRLTVALQYRACFCSRCWPCLGQQRLHEKLSSSLEMFLEPLLSLRAQALAVH
eukprot:g71870.t1